MGERDGERQSYAVWQTYSELLQVVDRERIPSKVEKRILEHASVAIAGGDKQTKVSQQILKQIEPLCAKINLRKDKSIPVEPLGVLGVVSHELGEKDVGNRCHAPRCSY